MNDYLRKSSKDEGFLEVKKKHNEVEHAGGSLDYIKLNAPFEIVENHISQLSLAEWQTLLKKRCNPIKENTDQYMIERIRLSIELGTQILTPKTRKTAWQVLLNIN